MQYIYNAPVLIISVFNIIAKHFWIYGTNHPQLKQYTRGVNHSHLGCLDSTHVYTYAHAIFTHLCVFTCVHAYKANVAS